jgi:ribokinase
MIAKPVGARVLVAGAINTDLVARVPHAPVAGETVTGDRFEIFAGGKASNQSVASARSGATTAILGAVGLDEFGRQRRADLEENGVDCQSVANVAGTASGVALILVEASGQNRIAYVPGATATVTAEQAVSAFARFEPDVVLITLELPLDALSALVHAARSAGKSVVLNAAPEPSSGRSLVASSQVLIVNEPETRELLGEDEHFDDWTDAAQRLRALGPRTVVITLGVAGALADCGEGPVIIPAPEVQVIDTTGAGDAFCGAFTAQLARGVDAITATQIGIIAGSLSVTKPGAQPSMPTWNEIAGFLRTTDQLSPADTPERRERG